MSFIVMKNEDNEFFTLDSVITLSPDWNEFMEFYNGPYPADGVQKHDYAACIWPLNGGFARFLGKDGNWGYIHEYSLQTFWLEREVLYAEDFSCGVARIQYADGTYNYLNSKLKCLSDFNYSKATIFKNGCATVSDDICRDYQIDTNGKVTQKDRKRYSVALELKKSEDIVHEHILNEREYKKRKTAFDPESSVMRALSGHGIDPEDYGF